MSNSYYMDEQGYFVGFRDWKPEDDQDPLVVDVRPPDGFARPRWDGRAWVEGEVPAVLLDTAKKNKKSQLRGKTTGLFAYLFPEAETQEEAILRALYELYMQDPRGNLRRIRAGIEKLDTALVNVDAAQTMEEIEAQDVILDPTIPKENYPPRPPAEDTTTTNPADGGTTKPGRGNQ